MTVGKIDADTLETLANSLRGPLIHPSDEGYDEARTVHVAQVHALNGIHPWNRMAHRWNRPHDRRGQGEACAAPFR